MQRMPFVVRVIKEAPFPGLLATRKRIRRAKLTVRNLGPRSPQWTQVAETLGGALSGIANWPHYESADMRSMCFAGIQHATLQHPPQKIVFVSELVE